MLCRQEEWAGQEEEEQQEQLEEEEETGRGAGSEVGVCTR